MPGPDPPRPQPEDMCGSPWLILHGSGPASEEVARAIDEQWHLLRITTRLRPIDSCGDIELARYSGLALSLPTLSSSADIGRALKPFADVIADYRMRRPHGLADILDGTVEWFDAGVVELFGERALLHNPAMRTALKQACHVQCTDEGGPFDPLHPYRGTSDARKPSEPWDQLGDVAGATIGETWRRIQDWGIDDLTCVPKMLDCLNRCRSHYEHKRFSQQYRPDPTLRRNRLDIILDGPEIVIGTKKTWNENGAGVWRYVYGQLKEVVPGIRRPVKHKSAGNAQKDLRRLYEDLKVLDLYGDRLPPSDS